jgi:N-acetylneuraminate synthase/N,N'-diacetyllegionaminate synthase
MTEIRIGRRAIGAGHPCFIAAEVGINHNGDLALAHRHIDAAADAGADGVKFQNYRTEDFLSDRTLIYTYTSQGREVTESQWDMFKRYESKPGWWRELKDHCDQRGVIFFCTPTSPGCVEELLAVGIPMLKNASDYLTNEPFLRCLGRTKLPVILSTGMADQDDVDSAVSTVSGEASPVMLLHCTSAYPTPPGDVNLRRMVDLMRRYPVPVGFSDHTLGWQAAVQAVTLGACIVEKHFTLDRNLPGPDHTFSSTPEEFRELVHRVRLGEEMMGRGGIAPAEVEAIPRREYRVSVVAARDLAVDTVLTEELVTCRRPGGGILPRHLGQYLGRRLKQPIARGTPLEPHHFE